MGQIIRYSCKHCFDIFGTVYYGIGMMFFENNNEYRLFGCYECGKVFERNINVKFNRCPKCRKKPIELKVYLEDDNTGLNSMNSNIICPKCKKNKLLIQGAGTWD